MLALGRNEALIEKRYEESGAYLLRLDYQGALEMRFSKVQPLQIDRWRETHPKYWHDKYQP